MYLGGLGDDHSELSKHLGSRHQVGHVLAAGSVDCVEFRAAAIIGSGSASFEMLRYLTEVLPVMVTPQWVRTECQPISIRDVLRYLVAVVEHEEPIAGVLEIGGPDVLSYADMMATYAEVASLPRRRLLPVPVLSPRLSSLWVGLVTPVPAQLARPLVDSLVNRVVVTDHRAEDLFPFARDCHSRKPFASRSPTPRRARCRRSSTTRLRRSGSRTAPIRTGPGERS